MKLVCRCLSSDGRLLGWTDVQASVPGDGHLRAPADVFVNIEESGQWAALSVHWPDLHVEVRTHIPPVSVRAGQRICIAERGSSLIKAGDPPVGLPPVTVGSSVVVVPTGGLGAVGN